MNMRSIITKILCAVIFCGAQFSFQAHAIGIFKTMLKLYPVAGCLGGSVFGLGQAGYYKLRKNKKAKTIRRMIKGGAVGAIIGSSYGQHQILKKLNKLLAGQKNTHEILGQVNRVVKVNHKELLFLKTGQNEIRKKLEDGFAANQKGITDLQTGQAWLAGGQVEILEQQESMIEYLARIDEEQSMTNYELNEKIDKVLVKLEQIDNNPGFLKRIIVNNFASSFWFDQDDNKKTGDI